MTPARKPIGWHITLRLEDGRNLAQGVRLRRLAARAILEAGRERGLFLFAVVDTHVHIGAVCEREVAGALAHAVECSLRFRIGLGVPFEPARIRPIVDQAHLKKVVPYILGNARRHGYLDDPGCEGTNLPDLLGLRVCGRYTIQSLRRLLPRLTRHELLEHLGLTELLPGTDPVYLAEAAAASLALPDLSGRSREYRAAQIAAARDSKELGLNATQAAGLLGVSRQTAGRLRLAGSDLAVQNAILLQMGLMEALAKSHSEAVAFRG